MAMQLSVLAILLLAVPALVGGLLVDTDMEKGGLLFRWISGQFLLWAGFQLLCVPMVLRQQRFDVTVKLFGGYMALLAVLAACAEIRRRKKGEGSGFLPKRKGRQAGRREGTLLWCAFGALLLFQLVQAVRLTYADADDAYYIAVAAIAENSDTMYRILPYTGGATMLDGRHGLAPFPIWIAFLARVSGMRTVMVAQVVLPVTLIAMTYGIFYLLGGELFPEDSGQKALFLIFTEILVLFGNYSIYTMENFMIARSRQGKAALGSIVLPFLLLLLLWMLKRLQKGERISAQSCLLLAAVMMSGCLCSTLGALLVCMAAGVAGILGAVCYRRPGAVFPLAACCIPCVGYAFLYLFLNA